MLLSEREYEEAREYRTYDKLILFGIMSDFGNGDGAGHGLLILSFTYKLTEKVSPYYPETDKEENSLRGKMNLRILAAISHHKE